MYNDDIIVINICLAIVYIYIYVYVYIYIYICITVVIKELPDFLNKEGHEESNERRSRPMEEEPPEPRPQTIWQTGVFLIYFSQSCIFLNWLSGALVGVGGSDFIG